MLLVGLPGKHYFVLKAGVFDNDVVARKLKRLFGAVKCDPITQKRADELLAKKQQNVNTGSITRGQMRVLLSHIENPRLREDAETFMRSLLLNVYNGSNPPVDVDPKDDDDDDDDRSVSMWHRTAKAIAKSEYKVPNEGRVRRLADDAEDVIKDAGYEVGRGKREIRHLAHEAKDGAEDLFDDVEHETRHLTDEVKNEFHRGEHEARHLVDEAEGWWETAAKPEIKKVEYKVEQDVKEAERGARRRFRKAKEVFDDSLYIDEQGDMDGTSQFAADDDRVYDNDDSQATTRIATTKAPLKRSRLARPTDRVRLRQRANVF
jgi:ElaB/YqjD/DUF883 family membrane-anchored ribosome-binding protein